MTPHLAAAQCVHERRVEPFDPATRTPRRGSDRRGVGEAARRHEGCRGLDCHGRLPRDRFAYLHWVGGGRLLPSIVFFGAGMLVAAVVIGHPLYLIEWAIVQLTVGHETVDRHRGRTPDRRKALALLRVGSEVDPAHTAGVLFSAAVRGRGRRALTPAFLPSLRAAAAFTIASRGSPLHARQWAVRGTHARRGRSSERITARARPTCPTAATDIVCYPC